MSEVSVLSSGGAVVAVAINRLISMRRSMNGGHTTLLDVSPILECATKMGLIYPSDLTDMGFAVTGEYVVGIEMPMLMESLAILRAERTGWKVDRLSQLADEARNARIRADAKTGGKD